MKKQIVYLQILKESRDKSTTYYKPLLHTPDGLELLWPKDNHLSKTAVTREEAAEQGFNYSPKSSGVEVAYNIKIEEYGTQHGKLAAIQVAKILRSRGIDVTNLEVYLLTGRIPQRVD